MSEEKDRRIAALEAALTPLAALGSVEGRRGRTAFMDFDEDGANLDVVLTDGTTFEEADDAVEVLLLLPAGAVRAARALLPDAAPGQTGVSVEQRNIDLAAEVAELRETIESYFDHDWAEKIHLWEEIAAKAIGREAP